jgi:hypothetical protein
MSRARRCAAAALAGCMALLGIVRSPVRSSKAEDVNELVGVSRNLLSTAWAGDRIDGDHGKRWLRPAVQRDAPQAAVATDEQETGESLEQEAILKACLDLLRTVENEAEWIHRQVTLTPIREGQQIQDCSRDWPRARLNQRVNRLQRCAGRADPGAPRLHHHFCH